MVCSSWISCRFSGGDWWWPPVSSERGSHDLSLTPEVGVNWLRNYVYMGAHLCVCTPNTRFVFFRNISNCLALKCKLNVYVNLYGNLCKANKNLSLPHVVHSVAFFFTWQKPHIHSTISQIEQLLFKKHIIDLESLSIIMSNYRSKFISAQANDGRGSHKEEDEFCHWTWQINTKGILLNAHHRMYSV